MTTPPSGSNRLRAVLRSRLARAGFAVGCLVVAATAWNAHINAAPVIAIPPPAPLPVPNAYDAFARAAKANVEPPLFLLQTMSIVDKKSPIGLREADPTPTPPPGAPAPAVASALLHRNTDSDRRAALARAEPGLAALRAALASRDAYRFPSQRGPTQDFTVQAKFRSLARSLSFEARLREHEGDYAGAANACLDAEQFGVVMPTGGSLIPRLVGYAVEAVGRRPLWELVDHLDAATAAAAARRLAAIDAARTPLADNLTEDKWDTLLPLVDGLRHYSASAVAAQFAGAVEPSERRKPWSLLDLFGGDDATSDGSRDDSPAERRAADATMLHDEFESLTHSKQAIIDSVARNLDANISASRQRYACAPPTFDQPHDPITRYFVENSPRSLMIKEAETRVDVGMLILALALRAYFVQHAAYPASLAALTETGILSDLPEDPFAPTAAVTFRYRRLDSTHFLLYSVGPDGIDDGGRPADARTDDGKPRYWPLATDKGDWVYGINTPKPLPYP